MNRLKKAWNALIGKEDKTFLNISNAQIGKNEIAIHVVGQCNTGKSTIQYLINEKLKGEGFNNVNVSVKPDFKDMNSFNEAMNKDRSERVSAVKSKLKNIMINEVQSVKSFK